MARRLLRVDVVARDGTPLLHHFMDDGDYSRFTDEDISCIASSSLRKQGYTAGVNVRSSTPDRLHLELVVEQFVVDRK